MVMKEKENSSAEKMAGLGFNKHSIKKSIQAAIGNTIEAETRRASQDMVDEWKNALLQIQGEQQKLIENILEDEKKSMLENIIGIMQVGDVVSESTVRENVLPASSTEKPVIDVGHEKEPVPVTNNVNAGLKETTEPAARVAKNVPDKKKNKAAEEKNFVCQNCGLDCFDRVSLERHIDWAHQDNKNPVKS